MSKHDSQQNEDLPEFADLEARLRQNRPHTSPISPAAKHRLRAQLLEDSRMNEPKLAIGRLTAVLSALILVVGIPLYFWAVQSSLSNGAASQPEAVAAQPTQSPTPLPTPTAVNVQPAENIVIATPTPLPPTVVPPVAPIAQAAIATVGEPVAMETSEGGPPSGTFFTVPVEVGYTLQGYEEAVLFIEYKVEDANGVAGGSYVTLITPADDGQITAELGLSNTFLTADGRIHPDIEFDVYINAYDAAAEQYINIFPGDRELAPHEQSMPYPYQDPATEDYLGLNAVAFDNLTDGGAEMTLALTAVLNSADVGEVTAVISRNNSEIASETVAITGESDLLSLPLTLSGLTGAETLDVTVTLNAGDDEIEISESVSLAELTAAEPNTVWLIDVQAEPNGETIMFTAVVGYMITDPYTGGTLEHRSSFTLPSGNGGGGGGGGGGGRNSLPVGVGMTTIQFGMGSEGMTAENWQEFMTMEIQLNGITADGSQQLVDMVVLSPESE